MPEYEGSREERDDWEDARRCAYHQEQIEALTINRDHWKEVAEVLAEDFRRLTDELEAVRAWLRLQPLQVFHPHRTEK